MGMLMKLLTAPVLAAPLGVCWLGRKLAEAADAEALDEDRLRGELAELQVRLDLGEMGEDEYEARESDLLARISDIREIKAERAEHKNREE